jgi:hypothetical protein
MHQGIEMILIVTEPEDRHANYVEQQLRQRNTQFVRFNPAQFPTEAKVSLSYSATGQLQGVLDILDEAIDLSLLTSAWYRRPQFPVPHQEITDPFCPDYLIEESKTCLNDVWNALDCPFLPATPSVIRRAELKASQLKAAAALGFELPPTLFTNSPEEFLEFYRQHNGNIVSKLPSGPFKGSGALLLHGILRLSPSGTWVMQLLWASVPSSFRLTSPSFSNYESPLLANRSLQPRSTRNRPTTPATTGGAMTTTRPLTCLTNYLVAWNSAVCTWWNSLASAMGPSIWW